MTTTLMSFDRPLSGIVTGRFWACGRELQADGLADGWDKRTEVDDP